MKTIVLAAALLAVATSAQAQEDLPQAPPIPPLPERPADLPPLNLEQTTSMRCAVHLAAVAKGQRGGVEQLQQYPPLEGRAKEFFVRVMARLMDEADLSREDVSAYGAYEAELLKAKGPNAALELMPACLALLDASGL